jgi:hypothetical protein
MKSLLHRKRENASSLTTNGRCSCVIGVERCSRVISVERSRGDFYAGEVCIVFFSLNAVTHGDYAKDDEAIAKTVPPLPVVALSVLPHSAKSKARHL